MSDRMVYVSVQYIAETPDDPTRYVVNKPSKEEILAGIEKETGVSAEILWAICQVESRCRDDATNGIYTGSYQIAPMHGLGEATRDFETAARWTAHYLLKNGYERDVWRSVACHAGCGSTGYVEKVMNNI